jgi:RNA recognition motif-containing protein
MLGFTTDIKRKDVMAKLFIGNIPHASTEVELRQWVESRGFSVAAAEVIYNRITGKSRGFGFVTLGEEVNIQSAINVLNGRRMNGRVLTVNEATPLTLTAPYTGEDRSELRSNPPVQDCKP